MMDELDVKCLPVVCLILDSEENADESYGSVLCFQRPDNSVFVFQLWVGSKHRRKGYGRKLMDNAIRWANGRAVVLEPMPYADEPVNVEKLREWYGSMGFKAVEGSKLMKRVPQEGEKKLRK